ncbi:MAG: c-type cytochrome domain-containing protein [bacterium]|nr:c-type cytochrome domain-containing protein [bacterium]
MTTHRDLILRIDRDKLMQTVIVLPVLLTVFTLITIGVIQTIEANQPHAEVTATAAPAIAAERADYPARGADLNPALFVLELPPPPLDALPYDIREPLQNGTSVPVKKRWLWLPEGTAITVSADADGALSVSVPEGALWWKEFYIETDRGAFLIERRIIVRVAVSERHPNGWAFYSSHAPTHADPGVLVVLPSTSDAAAAFMFASTDWLPTQADSEAVEVRFEDARGVTYPYVFPGQTQCSLCHSGAAGAYPNLGEQPIEVFGLHPNNLSPASFAALVAHGWIVGGEALLTPGYSEPPADSRTLDALTTELVGVMRNNCASCHNAAPGAAASFTAFVIDPNRAYTTDALIALLSADSRMMGDAGHPLVTPGSLTDSEIWLRINGYDGRRRMPPLEGGLPEADPTMIALWQAWIERTGSAP